MYTVSQKRANLFFCSVFVKYRPISVEIGMHVLKETFNKTFQKLPISLEIFASTASRNWGDRLSRQCCTYMYVLINHWIATNTTGSNCLKNCQTCSKLHYLYTTCSKCPPPARTKISDVDKLRRRIKTEWTVWIVLFNERAVGDIAPASTCLRSRWRHARLWLAIHWPTPAARHVATQTRRHNVYNIDGQPYIFVFSRASRQTASVSAASSFRMNNR